MWKPEGVLGNLAGSTSMSVMASSGPWQRMELHGIT